MILMLLKVDCLPNAVGKQPSIPWFILEENGRWSQYLKSSIIQIIILNHSSSSSTDDDDEWLRIMIWMIEDSEVLWLRIEIQYIWMFENNDLKYCDSGSKFIICMIEIKEFNE